MNRHVITVLMCFFTAFPAFAKHESACEVESHTVVNESAEPRRKTKTVTRYVNTTVITDVPADTKELISKFTVPSDSVKTQPNTEDKPQVVKKRVKASDERTSRIAMSTNAVDWAWYVTPNIEIQYAVHRRWTLDATAKYNNWTYFDKDAYRRNRQCRQEYSLGFRFWPWYTYSGWWFGMNAQYQDYSRRQVRNIYRKEEGDAFGLSAGAGYSVHIKPWLNIDFGIGFWGGKKYYKVYESADWACPECGKRVDRVDGNEAPSRGWFILPNYALASLMFIF